MYFYRPPSKLREGNVFSRVCLSIHRGGSLATITHDALDLTVQGPSPESLCISPFKQAPQLVISGGQDPRPIQTCSLEDLTI